MQAVLLIQSFNHNAPMLLITLHFLAVVTSSKYQTGSSTDLEENTEAKITAVYLGDIANSLTDN